MAPPLMFGNSRGGPNSLRVGFTDDGHIVAAPLSHGSNPNSNMAGRRREDDTNLVYGVAFRGREDGISAELSENVAPSMRSGQGSASRGSHALVGSAVRRLTPRECERLQGFPDDWTALGPDSRRYAALGDAVTVPVAEWIGRRIMRVAA